VARRYAFELLAPADGASTALGAIAPFLPTPRRKRTGLPIKSCHTPFEAPAALAGLTPDAPVFFSVSLLFPADAVRAFSGDRDSETEWDDTGREFLPVGSIDVSARTGARFAVLRFAAVTGGMSELFERSRPIWEQFAEIARAGGARAALFRGAGDPRVLPDGTATVRAHDTDFLIEERATYWHFDTDRYAAAVLAQL
jgi:hypothetical protein